MLDLNFLLVSFTGLLAILDPLAVVPIFLTLFGEQTVAERTRIARLASIAVAATLLTFMTIGAQVLAVLGISLEAFRVGGGILVLLMGLDMLSGNMSRVKRSDTVEDYTDLHSFAVVPLAIPLLSGPGAMSTAVLLSQQAVGWANKLALGGIVLVLAVIVYITLRLAESAQRVLGKTGIRVATRIAGLLLVALAVQFIADGLGGLFPALVHIAKP